MAAGCATAGGFRNVSSAACVPLYMFAAMGAILRRSPRGRRRSAPLAPPGRVLLNIGTCFICLMVTCALLHTWLDAGSGAASRHPPFCSCSLDLHLLKRSAPPAPPWTCSSWARRLAALLLVLDRLFLGPVHHGHGRVDQHCSPGTCSSRAPPRSFSLLWPFPVHLPGLARLGCSMDLLVRASGRDVRCLPVGEGLRLGRV